MKSESNKPFTVITPVYNGKDFIIETIESVLQFTNSEITEYIVVDDGSTDETSKLLKRYQDRITIVTQKNLGEAEAVNRGIKEAQGDYLLIVSADDPMSSHDLLSESKKIFENDSNLVCVYPDWEIIDENGKILRQVIVKDFSRNELVGKLNCLVGPGGVFRREGAIRIGGRRSKYKYVSDYDFWLRLSELGDFYHLKGIRAKWRSHDNSTSVSQKNLQMALERISVMEDFLQNYPQNKVLARRAKANAYYNAALLAYFDSLVPGRKWMMKALAYSPKTVSDFDIRIVFYVLFLPLSKICLPIIQKLNLVKKIRP